MGFIFSVTRKFYFDKNNFKNSSEIGGIDTKANLGESNNDLFCYISKNDSNTQINNVRKTKIKKVVNYTTFRYKFSSLF